MRIHSYLAFALAVSAAPAAADSHYSSMIGQDGIAASLASLRAQDTATPSDQFALGGLHVLRAVETALQSRYTYDMNSDTMAMLADIPFLRLPVAPNPAPLPFESDVIPALFGDVLDELELARQSLDQIGDTDPVAVALRPADVWFDINKNARRDPGEGLSVVMGTVMGTEAPIPQSMTIRFDTADAAWLSAYAHLLSGTSELILSTNPEQAIAATFAGAATMDKLRGETPMRWGFIGTEELTEIDTIAAIIVALEGPLDPQHTRAAHQHFLDGLSDNRTFWARLAAETDNTLEWIPNANQTSVMPIQFPAGIGDSWQAVLADAEAVLTGESLLPFWRLGPNAGLDLAAILQDPPVVDIIGLFQGYSLAPYAKTGTVIDDASLRAFDEVTGGNSPFFAIVLN